MLLEKQLEYILASKEMKTSTKKTVKINEDKYTLLSPPHKSGVHKFNSFNQCLQYVVSNKKQSNKEIVVISRRFFKESLNTLQAR